MSNCIECFGSSLPYRGYLMRIAARTSPSFEFNRSTRILIRAMQSLGASNLGSGQACSIPLTVQAKCRNSSTNVGHQLYSFCNAIFSCFSVAFFHTSSRVGPSSCRDKFSLVTWSRLRQGGISRCQCWYRGEELTFVCLYHIFSLQNIAIYCHHPQCN